MRVEGLVNSVKQSAPFSTKFGENINLMLDIQTSDGNVTVKIPFAKTVKVSEGQVIVGEGELEEYKGQQFITIDRKTLVINGKAAVKPAPSNTTGQGAGPDNRVLPTYKAPLKPGSDLLGIKIGHAITNAVALLVASEDTLTDDPNVLKEHIKRLSKVILDAGKELNDELSK